MLRRVFAAAAAVLAAGAVAVDRAAASVAANRVAEHIRAQETLTVPPRVAIGGAFLLQALRGRYGDVRVTLDELRRGPVPVTDLRVHLRGVRVPLADALRGRVRSVPVDAVDATAVLRYRDLTAGLPPERLALSEDGGRVRLRGSVVVFSRRLSGSAVGEVRVAGDRLTIVPHDITVDVGPRSLGLSPAVTAALTYTTTLSLPFGLRLRDVSVLPEGLRVAATGDGLVLGG